MLPRVTTECNWSAAIAAFFGSHQNHYHNKESNRLVTILPSSVRARAGLVLAIIVAAALLAWWGLRSSGNGGERYETVAVDTGPVRQVVSANGTLNPVVLVNVGTQVSGTVASLHADYNDRVNAGQVLARLDPSLIEAQLAASRASVANAEAELQLATANARRSRDLFDKQMIAQSALDQAESELARAQAQVQLARAQVQRDETNLRYTVIRAPVTGVVIARDVDVGQTVAASFQTPTLFKIAKDLREMQIDTNVAEADIGGIKVGMPVAFSVDAFPSREYVGTVRQIRLNPKIEQNVVSYNVVIGVDNRDQSLIPGMTANVRILIAERDNVPRVPNAALRYRPSNDAGGDGAVKRPAAPGGRTVYRLDDGVPRPVVIVPGIADNRYTEIASSGVKAGDLLVTRDREAKEAGNQRRRFGLF
jgi:HlyD family secretion protein